MKHAKEAIGLACTVIAAICAAIVVPEVREFLRLDEEPMLGTNKISDSTSETLVSLKPLKESADQNNAVNSKGIETESGVRSGDSLVDLTESVETCAGMDALNVSSEETARVMVGGCWEPCKGVAITVKEIFLDIDGRASDQVVIDLRSDRVENKSHRIGTALQLTESCQIRINGTGDTLSTQFADLEISSEHGAVKMY